MALSLDGSGFANATSTSVGVSLTTTAGSGVIVVSYIAAVAPAASNPVTASGLSFTQRGTTVSSGSNYVAIYTAPYSSNFSGTITVTASTTAYMTAVCWGVGGAATTSYFDTNILLPYESSAGVAAGPINTSNANDFIFAAAITGDTISDPNFVQLSAGGAANFNSVGYYIVSSPQTALTCSYSGSLLSVPCFMDAIIAGSGAAASIGYPDGSVAVT